MRALGSSRYLRERKVLRHLYQFLEFVALIGGSYPATLIQRQRDLKTDDGNEQPGWSPSEAREQSRTLIVGESNEGPRGVGRGRTREHRPIGLAGKAITEMDLHVRNRPVLRPVGLLSI